MRRNICIGVLIAFLNDPVSRIIEVDIRTSAAQAKLHIRRAFYEISHFPALRSLQQDFGYGFEGEKPAY